MNKIITGTKTRQNMILLIPDEKYQTTINNIVKDIVSTKKTLCFVSVNKTKEAIEKELQEKKIKTEKIYFIDCISKSISKGKLSWSDEKTSYIDNPNSLTQMSLAIFKLMEKTKIDYFLLDSINTLLIYNNEKSILKFVHHTAGKLKANNTTGLFIYLKEGLNENLLKQFTQFVDKITETGIGIKKETTKSSMSSFEEIKL